MDEQTLKAFLWQPKLRIPDIYESRQALCCRIPFTYDREPLL